MVDLLEQINTVINVLFEENQKLAAELEQLKKNNSIRAEKPKTP
jgi:regulator of replication initiation timing